MKIRLKKSEPKRILIVNRGEIASRIAKACRELGHTAVGVWTDNEVNAKHLEFCDEWVRLPGKTNAETYLNVDNILEIVEKYSIDGVHPGYGFLSENGAFAKALEKKGVAFVGPHVEAIRVMGDKATSKALAQKAGVPVVPGTSEAVPTVEKAVEVANQIGYPILLKAVAGGGGRGMRPCQNEEDIRNNFEAVGREAISAFGNGDLLVEKLIVNPHHIEVQILADKKGNVYHFFERECSVQRRHQKIVEEAPSPFIGDDEELRQEICQTAVKLAKAVRYDSAGTVEFIMGEDRSFYFLEMNTRIQVEHPITEEITGIDLIVCMIQAAFGEDLGIPGQEWITRSGHAIECRICAEDPISMLPAPGFVTGFDTNFPQGIRFDHCLYRGLSVTPDFDPMVGKLIAKGIVRDVAIRKMRSALNGLHIEGLKTNIPLHKIILEDEQFVEGRYSTNFIKERAPQEKIDTSLRYREIYQKLAAIEPQGWGFEMRTYLIDSDKNEVVIDMTRTIVHSSELVEFDYSMLEGTNLVNQEKVFLRKLAGSFFCSTDGVRWKKMAKQNLPTKMLNVEKVYNVFYGYKPSGLASGSEGELLTQMPGKVVKIMIDQGAEVRKGQTLLILEAMKMENEIKCGIDGIVKEIHVKEGDALESGVLMMEVEAK